MNASKTAVKYLQVLHGKRVTWTVSSIVLLTALLFLRSPAHSYAQEGDSAEPGEAKSRALIPSNRKFDHLTAEQGLSNNRVVAILQDSQGFMWFGTQDGLNRYDGYQFRVFRHKPENKNSLSANFVQVIFVDRDGMLWLGSTVSLQRSARTNHSPFPSTFPFRYTPTYTPSPAHI